MSDRKLPLDKSERILAELLKIPVNTICCDCGAANPKWASYSLGCFLCVRCCSVHRKMGTHISKVKSVTLDSWTQDDIDTMKNNGNGKVNALYMPHPERHPPPTSMEGSAMEQYIRSKYERKEFMEGGGNYQKPSSRSAYGNTFSGGRGSGYSNDVVNTQAYSKQMSALRAMGFSDNAKNLQVLQSTNGDVPNAIEILCRIGSGPVTSSANLASSNSTHMSSPARSSSRTYASQSISANNTGGGRDPKEAILWNMGFHDSALNKEALRRAGGNPEVAAGILIDEKDKLAKAVRDKASSSPLPARLEPPGSSNSNNKKNEDNLLLDLSTPDDNNMQQQQQHMFQQQMQMQNAFGNSNQQWGNQASSMDQFGQNHTQLQSILDKNASILALYNNDNNNSNNNNNMFGANGMNNAFGYQQSGNMGDMSSWAMNNNFNNNNTNMNAAFGLANNSNNNNAMGMGMNMGMGMGVNNNQQQINPFGLPTTPQQTSGNFNAGAFGTVASNPTGMPGNNVFNMNNSNNNNQFAGMSTMGSGSPMPAFNTLSTNNNNNMNMSMNMNNNNNAFMNGMGMGMGMNNVSSMNGMNGMNSPSNLNNNNNNNNFNTGFGMNQNNNANSNPWNNNNNNNNLF